MKPTAERFLIDRVRAFLTAHVRPRETLCAAISGGLDSMTLLDVLAQLRAALDLQLSAVHVNHGLSANAAAWEALCVQQCAQRDVALRIERVTLGPTRGQGLEAVARKARYAAFARCAAGHIVLAHHREDQAETVLLRLLRGAGVRGLGAMRAVHVLTLPHETNTPQRVSLLRPLLEIDRKILLEYAARRELVWSTDESNENLSLDRNFLRHEVLPRLRARFPHYAATFARAARHLAQTQALVDELGAADRAACAAGERLRLTPLRALPHARAVHVVREFIEQRTGAPLTTAQTEELLRQLTQARAGAQIDFRRGAAALRVDRDEAVLSAHAQPTPREARLCVPWRGEAALPLPAPHGSVLFTRQSGAGVSTAKLARAEVTLRIRAGSERLRTAPGRPTRTLKNLLQEARMPNWQRQHLPLLFCGEQLVCVPGIAIAADFQTQPGEDGIVVVWQQYMR